MTESKSNYIHNVELNETLIVFKNYDDNESKWFNRVYLCYEETNNKYPNTYGEIKGFNCYKYNSLKNANEGWYLHRKQLNKLDIRHTMIPICKWIPQIFDDYILNWKLRNIYWLGKHTIRKGYNGSFKEK